MTHHHSRVSDSASAFTSLIRALHEKIRDKIMKNNANYKAFAHLNRRLRTFNVSDCDGPPEIRTVSSGNREKITRAKRITFSNPQEDQSECLCGGPPTRFCN